jgi:hypothetical protein
MASAKKRKTPSKRKPVAEKKTKTTAPLLRGAESMVRSPVLWGLLISWGLALLALLSLPNAQLLIPGWDLFSHLPFYPLLLLGFAGMIYFFRKIPESGPTGDIDSQVSRPAFFGLMLLGGILRLYDLHRISGCIDNDHWIYANEALQIMVAGDRPILLPYGTREPLFAYFSAALWSLMPHATAIVAMRLACVAVDFLILWSFYLLGKEVGGRRLGLILMVMGTISKTLIQISKINFGFHTDVLACALVVLFLFRLLKNPKLSHFIEWGLALTLGSYIYVAFRLWTPVLIGGLWLWMLWRRPLRPKKRMAWALAFSVMLSWTFAFFCVNRVIPQWGWVQFFSSGGGLWMILAGLGALYVVVGLESRGEEWVWKWATGSLLTALLLSPLWMQPGYSAHPNEMVIFDPRFGLSKWEAIQYCLANFWNGFKLLFSWDDQNPFWNIPPMKGDSYMDFFVAAFGLAALASYLARPRLIQTVILGLFFVGYAAFFVTHGAHSNRLMATLLPMYLIAAWGAYRLWQAFRLSNLRHGARWGTALLLGIGLWSLVTNAQILEKWMNMRWNDTLAQDVLDDPSLAQARVYLVPDPTHFGESGLDLVCEGRDAHLAIDSNPIDLVEGEKGKDLAAVIWGGDDGAKDKLSKAFPDGTWHEKVSAWPVTSLKWIIVPFEKLSQNPADYFYVRYKPASFWFRQFYGGLGLGRGMIQFEDRAARWNDPVPTPFLQGGYVGRITGEWDVNTPGEYEVSFQTANTSQLWVDGREVLEMKRPEGNLLRRTQLNLSSGKHSIELFTAFNQEHVFPEVLIHSLSGGWDKPLEELSLSPEGSPAPSLPAKTP